MRFVWWALQLGPIALCLVVAYQGGGGLANYAAALMIGVVFAIGLTVGHSLIGDWLRIIRGSVRERRRAKLGRRKVAEPPL